MILIKNLWKKYDKTNVMAGLNLEIQTGETLVILGRSGVGKSVLLKHIIGISKPDAGSIIVNDQSITDLSGQELYKALHQMGMLFQGAALFDSMTVEENTGFYLTEHGKNGTPYPQKELEELIAHALEMVGLAGTQKKMPSELSGGMRKRAGLARLIVYRPNILLYDEPTTGLDPITAMHINELIVKTQQELKATSVVVTHDIISALYVGDRLALIDEGKIVCIDTPDNFMKFNHPIIDFLRQIISQDPRSFRKPAS